MRERQWDGSPWRKLQFYGSDSLSSPSWSPWPAGSPSGERTRSRTECEKEEGGRGGQCVKTKTLYWREWAAPGPAPGCRRWLWPPRRNSAAAQSPDRRKPEQHDGKRNRVDASAVTVYNQFTSRTTHYLLCYLFNRMVPDRLTFIKESHHADKAIDQQSQRSSLIF